MGLENGNLLVVLPSLEIGGAQANALRLASAYHSQNHNVAILTIKPTKTDFSFLEASLSPDIKVWYPPFFNNDLRDLRSPLDNNELVKKIRLQWHNETKRFNSFLKRLKIEWISSHMYLADHYLTKHLSAQRPLVVSKQCGCYNLITEEKKPQVNCIHGGKKSMKYFRPLTAS